MGIIPRQEKSDIKADKTIKRRNKPSKVKRKKMNRAKVIPKSEKLLPPPQKAPKRSDRNYSDELGNYLHAWTKREEGSGWKFNKVLQNWAIDNVFEGNKIVPKEVFLQLLPYFASIQGAARNRLTEICNAAISKEGSGTNEDGKKSSSSLRAVKVLKWLQATEMDE